jgi:hypothetical protein
VALVTFVHKGQRRKLAGEMFHLIKLPIQGVTIKGIARQGLNTHNKALLVGAPANSLGLHRGVHDHLVQTLHGDGSRGLRDLSRKKIEAINVFSSGPGS